MAKLRGEGRENHTQLKPIYKSREKKEKKKAGWHEAVISRHLQIAKMKIVGKDHTWKNNCAGSKAKNGSGNCWCGSKMEGQLEVNAQRHVPNGSRSP